MLLAGLKHLIDDLSPEFVENFYIVSEYLILDPFQLFLRAGDSADSVFFSCREDYGYLWGKATTSPK
tara:strand:- start:224 stop:424 length:201 start_codon:yes stop_codon:yes gene_type:complete